MKLRLFLALLEIIVRNNKAFQTAVTEHLDCFLSGDLTICPRVVDLKSSSSTVRIPVRVCNLSVRAIEIPPKFLVCFLSSVKIVDFWTLDSSKKKEQKSTNLNLEELGVKIVSENLTPNQADLAKKVLGNWSMIFLLVLGLGKTDLVKHEI